MGESLDLFEVLATPIRTHVKEFEEETADGIVQKAEREANQRQSQVKKRAEEKLTAVSLFFDSMTEDEQKVFGQCSAYFFKHKFLAGSHLKMLRTLVKDHTK